MFELNTKRLLANAARADTLELMDRVTVLREHLEAEALEIAEAELARRGITPEEIAAHGRKWKHRVLRDENGMVWCCSWCGRAAVAEEIGWHRWLGLIPIWRRRYRYCETHWRQYHPEAPWA
ncbi:MAG: hypothetical protein RMI91_12665 [Gemmatales bacterium]|nr:hypothetical protein [Gemmatales bacterium]MDW7995494.1 hypothetical protein [Gemmatales bacterium]